jgi:hypothetical protein
MITFPEAEIIENSRWLWGADDAGGINDGSVLSVTVIKPI